MNIKQSIIQSTNQIKAGVFNQIKTPNKIELNSQKKLGILTGIIGCVFLFALLAFATSTDVYSLKLADKTIGYVTEKSIVEDAISEIKSNYENETSDVEISVDTDSFEFIKTDLKKNEVDELNKEELAEKILTSDVYTAKGWIISADGKTLISAKSEKEAKQILADVKSHYLTAGSEVISADFKEDVIITKSAVELDAFMKTEEAVNLILTGEKITNLYTVADGDTVWDIAAAHGMSVTELQTANPGFDPNKLKIGQSLNLFAAKPYLTVETKELIASTEAIEFTTVYEETNTLYKGEVQVKTAGVLGSKQVKAEVSKVNGVITATQVLDSVVTAEPQTQIALQGTKPGAKYVASRGSGRSVSVDASGSEIVAYAKTFIGTPYRSAGSSPSGFDCSGFTQYVYANFGGSLPHSSASQYGYGTAVSKSELEAGDLVFFSNSSRISHVGIYVGGGTFIHSPQAGDSVKISSFSSSTLNFCGAVRIAD